MKVLHESGSIGGGERGGGGGINKILSLRLVWPSNIANWVRRSASVCMAFASCFAFSALPAELGECAVPQRCTGSLGLLLQVTFPVHGSATSPYTVNCWHSESLPMARISWLLRSLMCPLYHKGARRISVLRFVNLGCRVNGLDVP